MAKWVEECFDRDGLLLAYSPKAQSLAAGHA
jgi:hypothetical protein